MNAAAHAAHLQLLVPMHEEGLQGGHAGTEDKRLSDRCDKYRPSTRTKRASGGKPLGEGHKMPKCQNAVAKALT